MKLPKGWKQTRLGDAAEFINGRGFKPSEWKESGLPIIRIQNLNGSKIFNYYDGDFAPKILVQPEDLLFAWSGSKGSSFGPHFWRLPTEGLLNYHTWRIVCRDRLDRNFAYHSLKDLTYRIEHTAQGAAGLVHIQKGWIEDWELPLPPLSEQRKIADILSTWDEALEKLDALIAAKDRRKQALMQQLLTGSKRVKGAGGKWKRARFGDFLTESRIPGTDGTSTKKITVKLYGRGVHAKQERLAGSENTKYYTRKAGQLIYSKLDFLNGAFGIIPDHLDGYESTLDLPTFEVSAASNARWILYYVTRPEFYTQQLGAAAGGRKARRVNPSEFLAMKFLAPSVEEQRQIATILDTADQELTLLRRQRAALDHQKRGLMQRLLTGRIRVTL